MNTKDSGITRQSGGDRQAPAPGDAAPRHRLTGDPVCRPTAARRARSRHAADARPQLLEQPTLNKDAAFTRGERDEFGLRGLLPWRVATIEEQVVLELEHVRRKTDDLEKYIGLAALHDRNETLFHRLLVDNIEELAPIVYTPTVGDACRSFSHIQRRPRGLWITPDDIGCIPRCCATRAGPTSGSSSRPTTSGFSGSATRARVGWASLWASSRSTRRARVCTQTSPCRYRSTAAPTTRTCSATRSTSATRNRACAAPPMTPSSRPSSAPCSRSTRTPCCSGRTSSSTTRSGCSGTTATASRASTTTYREPRPWSSPACWPRCGCAARRWPASGSSSPARARQASASRGSRRPSCASRTRRRPSRPIVMLDSRGLVFDGRDHVDDDKRPFALPAAELTSYGFTPAASYDLETVVRQVAPDILVGTSGTPGVFTEPVIREMAARTPAPIVLPLSNPTAKSEATPADVLEWSEGRALVATGSPFDPVRAGGRDRVIGQANNVFIFPGVGLGAIVSRAREVTDRMFLVAARTLADVDRASGSVRRPVSPHRGAAVHLPRHRDRRRMRGQREWRGTDDERRRSRGRGRCRHLDTGLQFTSGARRRHWCRPQCLSSAGPRTVAISRKRRRSRAPSPPGRSGRAPGAPGARPHTTQAIGRRARWQRPQIPVCGGLDQPGWRSAGRPAWPPRGGTGLQPGGSGCARAADQAANRYWPGGLPPGPRISRVAPAARERPRDHGPQDVVRAFADGHQRRVAV